MAACAVMLLGACERSNDQTTPDLKDEISTPRAHQIDATTKERLETLRKRQDSRLNADALVTPTPSPAAEK